MKLHLAQLAPRLLRKAATSVCRSKVAAAGLNHRGKVISIATNTPRLYSPGGGIHAEQHVLFKSPRSLRTILIVRVGRSGRQLPISPCGKCQRFADRFGVNIVSL